MTLKITKNHMWGFMMWFSMTSSLVLYPLSHIYIQIYEFVHSIHIHIYLPGYIPYLFHIQTHTHMHTQTFPSNSTRIQSQRLWSFEGDIEAADEIYAVSWDLLVLKFCKTRISLEGVCPVVLALDLWVPPNIPLYFGPEIHKLISCKNIHLKN